MTAKILKYSSFPDCRISVSENESAFVRFANNGVTTAGLTLQRTVGITSVREGRAGAAQTTELSDEALKAAVLRSEQLAAIAPINPEYVEPVGPQQYADYGNFDEATGRARSPELLPQIEAIVDAASARKLISSGYFERLARTVAIANKRSNFGFARGTDARLSTTMRNAAGTSSGWAGQPSVRLREISGADLASRAIDKCLRWTKPARLEPGKYTVVLEPTAVGDLLSRLGDHLSARAAEQGQSFLSRKGGGTLVGEKLFPEFITIRTDPFDLRYATALWSLGDLPARPVTWIENGVVKNVVYDRYWAMKTGKSPTPASNLLVMEGSKSSVSDLIKGTDRGLLVTRFWYVRPVNPQTVQLTGLTRDGLFLIEGGKITQPVMNFRFTESVVRMLQNATMISENVRTRGAEDGLIAPAVQARDFTFTSVSDAV